MNKYLSIGEVVKMKGISHRALRHYDDIGILVPAYVNKDSGYRYYSKNQIIILDIITLCVVFGIPLKQFKNYMLEDGSIDVQKMSEDAQVKALEVQEKLKQNLYFLNSVAEHFAEFDENISHGQAYKRKIKQRYFITIPAPKDFGSIQDYWTNLTNLYTLVEKNNYSMSANQGSCFTKKNNTVEAKYYVEIKAPKKANPNILVVPEAEFICEIFDDNCLHDALNKYKPDELGSEGILIFNDLLERKITNKPVPFEVQLML